MTYTAEVEMDGKRRTVTVSDEEISALSFPSKTRDLRYWRRTVGWLPSNSNEEIVRAYLRETGALK